MLRCYFRRFNYLSVTVFFILLFLSCSLPFFLFFFSLSHSLILLSPHPLFLPLPLSLSYLIFTFPARGDFFFSISTSDSAATSHKTFSWTITLVYGLNASEMTLWTLTSLAGSSEKELRFKLVPCFVLEDIRWDTDKMFSTSLIMKIKGPRTTQGYWVRLL